MLFSIKPRYSFAIHIKMVPLTFIPKGIAIFCSAFLMLVNQTIGAQNDEIQGKPDEATDLARILFGYLQSLDVYFAESEVTFKYEVRPGVNGVEYFQARALLRAFAASEEPSNNSIDKNHLAKWGERTFDVEAVFSKGKYSINTKEVRGDGRTSNGRYRFDGNRFFMSTKPNRWDIVSPISRLLLLLSPYYSIYRMPLGRSH